MATQHIDGQPALPYHRVAGTGLGVVCIHCNASSWAQWRELMDQLAPRHLVLAPDTHGAGRGPIWPTGRPLSLSDEVDLLEPLLRYAGVPGRLGRSLFWRRGCASGSAAAA